MLLYNILEFCKQIVITKQNKLGNIRMIPQSLLRHRYLKFLQTVPRMNTNIAGHSCKFLHLFLFLVASGAILIPEVSQGTSVRKYSF